MLVPLSDKHPFPYNMEVSQGSPEALATSENHHLLDLDTMALQRKYNCWICTFLWWAQEALCAGYLKFFSSYFKFSRRTLWWIQCNDDCFLFCSRLYFLKRLIWRHGTISMKTTRLLSNTDLGNKSFYFPFWNSYKIKFSCKITTSVTHVVYVSFSVQSPVGGHMLKKINWIECQSGYCLRCSWSVDHGLFEGWSRVWFGPWPRMP